MPSLPLLVRWIRRHRGPPLWTTAWSHPRSPPTSSFLCSSWLPTDINRSKRWYMFNKWWLNAIDRGREQVTLHPRTNVWWRYELFIIKMHTLFGSCHWRRNKVPFPSDCNRSGQKGATTLPSGWAKSKDMGKTGCQPLTAVFPHLDILSLLKRSS